MVDSFSAPGLRLSDVEYALGRLPTRTYVGKSFRLAFATSRDVGQLARYVNRVFDDEGMPDDDEYEWEEIILRQTARTQITMMIAREQGVVRQLKIQKVKTSRAGSTLETLLELNREQTGRLINTVKLLDRIPIEGDTRIVVDDDVIGAVLEDPEAIRALYRQDKERLRELIRNDSSAKDLVALAHRREQLAQFRMLLDDTDRFDGEAVRLGGPEKVWQDFLEQNPWILGIGLAGHLLTAWSDQRLEQIVAGFSIGGAGKRVDALMRTAGVIRSMVFAEIKHHRTPLLDTTAYRPGCWAPSKELSGGVTQVQQTVYRAAQQLSDKLRDTDDSGADLDTDTYLIRPRSFLIIGHLDQLRGDVGVHTAKQRSLELYRRNLYEPEILTFDELLARAEWHLTEAGAEADELL